MPDDALNRWQNRLLPLMVGVIVITAIFFAVITIVEFGKTQELLFSKSIQQSAVVANAAAIPPANFEQQQAQIMANQLVALEHEALARRYNQNNLVIAMRMWTRMMGFVTGMILALIGAAFVLGKLNEDTTELSASGSGMAMSLKSASPGVLLCVLGTILMTLTIWVQAEIYTKDVPLYVSMSGYNSYGDANSDVDLAPAGPDADKDTEFRGSGISDEGETP